MSGFQNSNTGGGGGSVTGARNGTAISGTEVILGGPLTQDTEITNVTASGLNLGYPLRIYTADFGGYGAFIGVIPDPADPSNPVNIAGMQTYDPSGQVYIAYGASNNALVTKAENTGIADFYSSVNNTETSDQDFRQRQTQFSTGGTPYEINNFYYTGRAADESVVFQESITGMESERYMSTSTLYERLNGVDTRISEFLPTEGWFITNMNGTRNSSGVAQGWYERGAIGASWTKRLEVTVGDNPTNDWGEYYRSQRRISVDDTDPNTSAPLYTYTFDSGTNIGWGTYTIKSLEDLAISSLWDNVIHIDMGLLIENSQDAFGQTDYIEIVLPAPNSQYEFGREFTLDLIPCTDPGSVAYNRYVSIISSDGSTIGGLAPYNVSANEKLSITLKGGSNPTQYEVIEGMSATRFNGRLKTFSENYQSQNGTELQMLGDLSNNPFEYILHKDFFQVNGDRVYGKLNLYFNAGTSPKYINMQFDGSSVDPAIIGIAGNLLNPVVGCLEFEFIRVASDNMYASISFTASDSTLLFDNIGFASTNISGPMNYTKAITLTTTTSSGSDGDIILKSGSFINFEPGIVPN
jgi:hypothetical protein